MSKNLTDNEKVVETALRNLPIKMESIGRTVSYGSWLNTFLCSAEAELHYPCRSRVSR
ncbi:hypothetical protein [Kibdelosporangium philippinense]|uniref:hypothetical protein n=1 Tax=Kibdelosporangium philippinense TaxID=211113 RepID=UPI0036194678